VQHYAAISAILQLLLSCCDDRWMLCWKSKLIKMSVQIIVVLTCIPIAW